MTSETIAIIQTTIQTIVTLAGIGGIMYWGSKWFKALQGAVDAQKTTIEAQKVHVETMTNVLNVVDAPKMLERYNAHMKLLDIQNEATLKQYEEEKKGFIERLGNRDVGITNLLAIVRSMTPYVPHDKRMEIIATVNLAAPELDDLRVIADSAPDLVAEENNKRLELFREAQEELEELRKALEATVTGEKILKFLSENDRPDGYDASSIGASLKIDAQKIDRALNLLDQRGGPVIRNRDPSRRRPEKWRIKNP